MLNSGDMRATMNISLPDDMKAFVDEQVAGGRYSTASEYIRCLLRDAQSRAEEEQLEALLLDGLNSGAPADVTPERWAETRDRVARRLRDKKRT